MTRSLAIDSDRGWTDAIDGRRVVVLTGAGISTDSGIPDYRGPHSPKRTPMTYADFVGSHAARQRYWSRSFHGWRAMARAVPNDGHRALADLERYGVVSQVITQNVDGLHTAAGSRAVIDLHGRLDRAVCLDCGGIERRTDLDIRLRACNPGGDDALQDDEIAPDGDAEVATAAGFVVAACIRCGGILKPDVVFFGENVPKPVVQQCFELVDRADALVVVGSSLTVLSGYRFARHAAKRRIPLVVVNRGATRADGIATRKIDGGATPTLLDWAERVADGMVA